MPQAALPDLNTQWIINSKEFWASLKAQDYTKAFGSLYDVNAMLPKDYQVRISDVEYNDLISQDVVLVCPLCSLKCEACQNNEKHKDCIAERKRSKVIIKRVPLSFTIKLLTNRETDLKWKCPTCNHSFRMSTTRKIKEKLQEPYFLQVVPNPPLRKNGIIDRKEYPRLVKSWLLQFQNELQHQMSNFRLEYKGREEGEGDQLVPDGQEHLDEFVGDP